MTRRALIRSKAGDLDLWHLDTGKRTRLGLTPQDFVGTPVNEPEALGRLRRWEAPTRSVRSNAKRHPFDAF